MQYLENIYSYIHNYYLIILKISMLKLNNIIHKTIKLIYNIYLYANIITPFSL